MYVYVSASGSCVRASVPHASFSPANEFDCGGRRPFLQLYRAQALWGIAVDKRWKQCFEFGPILLVTWKADKNIDNETTAQRDVYVRQPPDAAKIKYKTD